MSHNILVIAAHPDDEILGCGATLAKHVKKGDSVHVLILAEGITSRFKDYQINEDKYLRHVNNDKAHLLQACQNANNLLGVTSLHFGGFPDNRMDSIDKLEVIKCIEKLMETIKPNIVYTHHAGDVNNDHQITNAAVLAACRPQPGHCVEHLLFFETVSSTEWQPNNNSNFCPNWFINVSETLDIKLRALQEYKSEIRPWPHSRSIESLKHLACWRGASVGVEAAEAFCLGRFIDRQNSNKNSHVNSNNENIILRKANIGDVDITMMWRNDPVIRNNSLDKKIICTREHIDWFNKTLADSSRVLLIAELEDNPLAVIRIDKERDDLYISIYLKPEIRNMGFGSNILPKSIDWIKCNLQNHGKLFAKILPTNIASLRLFKNSGFVPYYVLYKKDL